MATLSDIGNFWVNRSGMMYERFLGACLKAAYDIKNEAAETENHVVRLAWADAILGGVEATVQAKVLAHMRYAIASNATLQSVLTDATDNDISYIVGSQINILA